MVSRSPALPTPLWLLPSGPDQIHGLNMRGDPPPLIIVARRFCKPHRTDCQPYTRGPRVECATGSSLHETCPFSIILAVLAAAAALVLPFKLVNWAETRPLSGSLRTPADPNALRAGVMVHPTIYYVDPNGEAAGSNTT